MSKTTKNESEFPKLTDALIKSVVDELAASLPMLAKADDEKEESKEETSEAPPKDEAPAPETSDSAPEADEASTETPVADEASASPEATPAVPPAPMDPMVLIASLQDAPLEQVMAAYKALKEITHAKMQAAQQATMAPPPAAPVAAPPAAPPMAAPAMKGELKVTSEADGSDVKTAKKSEVSSEVELLKAELKSQSEKVDVMQKALELALATPIRKAVTGLNYVAKSEVEPVQMSKSEVDAKLREVVRNPKLAKSDREKINAYYNSHQVDTKGIEHLLK